MTLMKTRTVSVTYAPAEECEYDTDMYEAWGNCPYRHQNPSVTDILVPEWVFNQETEGFCGNTYWQTSVDTHVFHWLMSQYCRGTDLVILASTEVLSDAEKYHQSESNGGFSGPEDDEDYYDVIDD